MNCVNCGAPLPVDQGGAVLECQHCGSAEPQLEIVRLLELGTESDKQCPVCRVALFDARLEGVPLRVCRGCSGMLIEMQYFVTVVEVVRMHTTRAGSILPRRQKAGERTRIPTLIPEM